MNVGSDRGVAIDSEASEPGKSSSAQALAPVASADGEVVPLRADGTPATTVCMPRLMPVNLPAPLGPNLFILGEPLLHRYYTVYDWQAARIGFGYAAIEQNRQ